MTDCVAAFPAVQDVRRLELVARFEELKKMRDQTMERHDLIGYEKLQEAAKYKGVSATS